MENSMAKKKEFTKRGQPSVGTMPSLTIIR